MGVPEGWVNVQISGKSKGKSGVETTEDEDLFRLSGIAPLP
jgi:hypothetical protein